MLIFIILYKNAIDQFFNMDVEVVPLLFCMDGIGFKLLLLLKFIVLLLFKIVGKLLLVGVELK